MSFFSAICFPICFRIWPYAVFKVLLGTSKAPYIFIDALRIFEPLFSQAATPHLKKSFCFLSGYSFFLGKKK